MLTALLQMSGCIGGVYNYPYNKGGYIMKGMEDYEGQPVIIFRLECCTNGGRKQIEILELCSESAKVIVESNQYMPSE